MKNILISSLFVLSFTLFVSCEDEFEEINRNPNQPEEVLPQLILPNVINVVVSDQVNDAWGVGNLVVQYSAQIRDPGTDRYVWGSFSGTWNTLYNILRDINNIQDLGEERGESNYVGIALIMKSLAYQILTDAYGDIPYEQAQLGKEEQVYFVPYTPQEAIYAGMLADLRTANDIMSEDGGVIQGDILFGGDVLKWRKFANSLRLRLLARQSLRIDPSAQMQEIVTNPNQFPIMESNADNAILSYLNESPNLFPIAFTREGSWLDRRLSKTLSDQLNELADPRISVYAQPTENSAEAAVSGNGELIWDGVRNGETDDNLSSDIDQNVSQLGSIYYVEQGTAVPAEGIVMTVSEVQFILAEAAAKGWISGEVETFYRQGIEASVDYYAAVSGQPISLSEEYFAQEGVALTPENTLERIGTQKWIALYFNGLEGWFEWKRTGFPNIDPAIVNSNNDQIPVRFQYPLEQQVLNDANYREAVSRQGTDDINTNVWWDVE